MKILKPGKSKFYAKKTVIIICPICCAKLEIEVEDITNMFNKLTNHIEPAITCDWCKTQVFLPEKNTERLY